MRGSPMTSADRRRRLACLVALLFAALLMPDALDIISDAGSWVRPLGTIEDHWEFDGGYTDTTLSTATGGTSLRDEAVGAGSDDSVLPHPTSFAQYQHHHQHHRLVFSKASIEEYHRRKLEEDRSRRSIHVMVTTIVAITVPALFFLAAVLIKKWHRYRDPLPRRKRRSRSERIRTALKQCRYRLPTADTEREAKQRNPAPECPICLSSFCSGDLVIVPTVCHCCRRISNAASLPTAATTTLGHRIFFHEDCIHTWLSHRTANPEKLCPCCRQPFLREGKE